MTSINKIRGHFDAGALSNRFHVNIYGPNKDFSVEGIRCESVSLPGRSLTTSDFATTGTIKKKVTQVNNTNEIDLVFVCDSSFFDRYIIEAWQSFIFTGGSEVNAEFKYGSSKTEGSSIKPAFRYPKDYYGEMTIEQFRRDDSMALKYQLYEVFPVSFEPMQLAMGDASLLKFGCKFAFKTFDTEYGPAPKLSVLNKGRRYLDLARESLTVASRFNDKSKDMLGKLNNLDSAGSRLSNILGGGI